MSRPASRRLKHTTAVAAVITGLAASPAAAQELDILLADGAFETVGAAVSADGTVVVGQSVASSIEGPRAFRWTWDGGFEPLADVNSTATAISADGAVIVGSITGSDATRAFRWTQADGLVELDLLDGSVSAAALGVSGSGAVIVGRALDAGNLSTAVRWSADGAVESLGVLDGGNRSTAFGVSGDGNVIVGESSSATSGPWTEAFRWTEAAGMVALGKLNNSDRSQARAASWDGGVIVGWAADGATQLQTAFRWTEDDGMESLGMLSGGNLSLAYDVSDDGLVIVGTAADGEENNTRRAFRWTEESGMQTVEDWLRDAGAEIAANVTRNAYGVNADGTVVVGDTHDDQMFIARLSSNGDGDDDGPDGGDDDGPPAGLITIDDLGQSLTSAGSGNSLAVSGMGLFLNGAGSRPLDRRASAGRSLGWISGDWGRDDHGVRDGEIQLGELGLSHNFGGLQLNAMLGRSRLDQNTLLDGRTRIDAGYVKLEALAPLHRTDSGALWLAVTGAGLWGEADLYRNYVANGGLIDSSRALTDVEGYGVRARVQWEPAGSGVSPYGELSFARACLDAYAETGGAFPAAFDRLCDEATEARYGLDMTIPLTDGLRLISTVEGVHRFEDGGADVTGQVIGLGGFDLGQARYRQDWLRGGAGFELDLGGSTLSVMGNGTTRGESAAVWIAAHWRVAF
ncbi:MAG: putative HAF family extracellular repeat protein [Brevundimonas sp.]|jgi:probable HAF family extracellular repeat protein|uniref:hypothetical protein n=1 Tax=Brevundimonas sp. TaxID=1871086 RepID=UPI0039E25443